MKKNIKIIYLIMVIFLIVTLGTYALISWMSDENTEISFRIGSISSVSCSGESTVTLSNLGPVFNYEQDGDMTEFTVFNESGTSVSISASIYIDSISDSLKRSDFKYAVQYSSDNSSFQTVATGNFSNVSANSKLNILPGHSTSGTGYFRVIFYIDGNMANPVSMQNSSLSGKLKICTNASLEINETSLQIPYSNTKTINYTYDGDGTIVCAVENENIATCSVNNTSKTVTINSVGLGETTFKLIETKSTNLVQDLIEIPLIVNDSSAPVLAVTSNIPESTTESTLTISGNASDSSGIDSVIVTVGSTPYPATIDSDGNWSVLVTLSRGANTISIIAKDKVGNTSDMVHKVNFFSGCKITLTGNGNASRFGINYGKGCIIEVEGIQYNTATELTLPVGTVIKCIAYGVTTTYPGEISVNGSIVAKTDNVNKFSISYNYVVTNDVEINLTASYSSSAGSPYGRITITET